MRHPGWADVKTKSKSKTALAATSKKRSRLYWTDEVPACIHCNSTHYERSSRNYCSRCYRLAHLLEAVRRWVPRQPRTWRLCAPGFKQVARQSHLGAPFRKHLITTIQRRLSRRIDVENIRNERVYPDGHSIEIILCHLTGGIRGKRRSPYYGLATPIHHSFDKSQRCIIWIWLNEIHELNSRHTRTLWDEAWKMTCEDKAAFRSQYKSRMHR
jgi:hypothetical protein